MQTYTNIAFISYKREDERWAKWLQRKLEHYRIPSVVCQENPNAPKKLRPIFRDKTDLTSGTLKGSLHQALLDSHYLIVICSPNATKSNYVNLEAQTFVDAGRAADIIPFIIQGVPYAEDKEQECYPEALLNLPKEQELLGVNIQEVGKQKALVRVAARILGVRFDSLWGRYRRFLIRLHTLMAALIILVLGAAAFVWDYNHARYEYYADYVDCFGLPQGVIELTKNQVAHRNRCYQFEYRRTPLDEPNAYQWRLAKVRYINSAKRTQEVTNSEIKDRYPIVELEYNPRTGNLSHLAFCNTQHRVLLRYKLSERNHMPATVVDLEAHDEQQGSAFIGANMASMSMSLMDVNQKKSNIIRLVYERNEQGYIVKQTFHANNDPNPSRSAVCDENGIFGIAYDLDSLGRRVAVHYLGLNSERVATKIGIASKNYEYDRYGNIYKATYLNLDNQPILNEEFWAICVDSVNEDGNIVTEEYFGTDGQPCLSKEGYANLAIKYNKHGYINRITYYDTNGNKSMCNGGYAIAVFLNDRRGNIRLMAYFDTDSQPCSCIDRYSRCVGKYDKQGRLKEESYYNIHGNPCTSSNGYHRGRVKYNQQGKPIEYTYFNTEKQPCANIEGFARSTVHYDDYGNEDERAYYDLKGNLFMIANGYARITTKYDNRGNITEETFYGADGHPCLSKDGYSRCTFLNDDLGNEIERAYFDTDGQPCLCKNGMAKWTVCYDDRGNCIEQVYFGTDNQPCLDNNGVSKWTARYDDRGNCIETSFFGTNGQPCLRKDGVAKWTAHYDNRGNRIEQSYFGTDGQLCLCPDGFAKLAIQYDERGNIIDIMSYGLDGKPCLCAMGYARQTLEYDEQCHLIKGSYWGVDNQLTMNSDGFAIYTTNYDYGFQIEEAYFNAEGKPCLNQSGWHKWCLEDIGDGNYDYVYYDDKNQPIDMN